MKWISHEILTGAVVYAFSGDILYAMFSMAGSVLPDKMEGSPQAQRSYWSWRSRHRGTSHWPAPYLFVIALLLFVTYRHRENIARIRNGTEKKVKWMG